MKRVISKQQPSEEKRARVVVNLSRAVFRSIIAESRKKGRTPVEEMAHRLEVPYSINGDLAATSGSDEHALNLGPLRGKRPGGTVWPMSERLVFQMPLELKCVVLRIAREQRLSQSHLALAIVQAALRDEAWLSEVIATAKQELKRR